MPKETFYNLPETKREKLTAAATEEFAQANFHTASINQICKNARIAKGSFYQYFADKLDLYVYVMRLAVSEKIKYFSVVLEAFEELTLLEQIRLLFSKGIEFTHKHPVYAALGEQFAKEDDETAINAVLEQGEEQAQDLFINMIDNAKAKGEINPAVDSFALCMLLQSVNRSVNKYMLDKFENVDYETNKKEVDDFIDSLLNIIFAGIQHDTNQ